MTLDRRTSTRNDAYVDAISLVLLANGEEPIETLGASATFGATEILSGRLRNRSATAEQETLVLEIEADDFFDLLANNIEIVKALFRQLLEKEPEATSSETAG